MTGHFLAIRLAQLDKRLSAGYVGTSCMGTGRWFNTPWDGPTLR